MKRHRRSAGETLDQFFGRAPKPSPEQMDSSRQRILQRLSWQRIAAPDALMSLLRSAPDADENPPVRKPLRPVMIALAVVEIVAVVGLMALVRNLALHVNSGGMVQTVEGTLYRVISRAESRVVQVGEKIENGALIHSDSNGALLVLADGSRVEMRSDSELSVERASDGIRIRLSSGSIIVNAAKQRTGHLYVQTKDATVSVVGTVFLVNAEEAGSRVAVIQGQVEVQQGPTWRKLSPGEQVATNPVMVSASVIEEISWSRNAAAHIALLEQSRASLQQSAITASALESQNQPEPFAFEMVSIRRSNPITGERGAAVLSSGCTMSDPQIDAERFVVAGTTLHSLVAWAYGSGSIDLAGCRRLSALNLVSGGADWVRSEQWDIEAVIPQGSPSYTPEQLRRGEVMTLRRMLRTLLENRFKVAMRGEMKEVPAYTLTAENGAPKSPIWAAVDSPTSRKVGARLRSGVVQERGAIVVRNAPIADLIPLLEWQLNRPVLDRTALMGQFSFVVNYAPLDQIQSGAFFGPSIFAALQEQVGLKLEPTTTSMEVWVVERAEKPSEN
jgi:uncharacterized protein (TIGR03435 family)